MNTVVSFDADVTAERIASAIQSDGAAIITGLLEMDQLECLNAELEPLVAATQLGTEDFTGHKTKRLGALMAKCPAARELALHPLILAVTERVLGPYCARFQLNYTGVMYLEPGEKAQTLHRDTGFYPIQNPAPSLILASMWALSEFSAANGATCVVPGSHLWSDDRVPLPDEIATAQMPAGSVLLYTGGTVHGGGANRTNKTRAGVALHYSLAWLRQEENQYMVMPMEEAAKLPRQLQELMGYELATVNLGFIDHQHPNDVLNGVAGDGPGQLGPQALMDADNAIRRFKVASTDVVGRARFDVVADPSDSS